MPMEEIRMGHSQLKDDWRMAAEAMQSSRIARLEKMRDARHQKLGI
jgi:hypothetical protein